MSMNSDTLSPIEQKKLEVQLANIYGDIVSISDDMKAAKQLGEVAKSKAQTVETGFFRRKKAIENLKDATITTADTTLATLDVVDKLADNQQRLANACNLFLQLGAMDIATNRAVIAFIENAISGGAEHTLDEETIAQLKGVIQDLKNKQDFLIRQKKQGEKINEHEHRLAENAEREYEQEKQLYDLHQKNIEQDERLRKGEEKDTEQDALLEDQRQKESEHEKVLVELELRIKTLESDLKTVRISKRTMLYWAISIVIGLIGVILGIIALIK